MDQHTILTSEISQDPSTARLAKMSYEEFLESPDFDGLQAEWVNGEVTIMSPASTLHQRLVKFLSMLLQFHVEAQGSGEVFFAPMQVKLGPSLPGREPDIFYVSGDHMDRIKK